MIDLAGELAARQGLRFENYTDAVRNLTEVPGIPPALVRQLVPLAGFRNVLIHEYVSLDFRRVLDALDRLEPVEQFAEAVRRIESGDA